MLYNYQYINHPLEKLQEYLDNLVLEVWCKAEREYSLDLLHPELKEIVLDFFYDDAIKKDYLDGPIKSIYGQFLELSGDQRDQIARSYQVNNSIEELCRDCEMERPITYANMRNISMRLSDDLKKFYKDLFTEVIHKRAIRSRLGNIDEHFEEFRRHNKRSYCPFCGLYRLKGVYHTNREAYDHFLPKGTYPFNSVNLRNLAPMCHECNSTYKLAKDPLADVGHRDPLICREASPRKAFYPYSSTPPEIKIELELRTGDIENLTPEDIDLSIKSDSQSEEAKTWTDIFKIEERYKAVFCEEDDGKAWFDSLISDAITKSMSSRALFEQTLISAKTRPFTDTGFLKAPFLEACERRGLFQ